MNRRTGIARLICIQVLVVIVSNGIAQDERLYMPLEMQKAYEKGFRSRDGKPGENYWHNFAEYRIDCELLPGAKILRGSEKVTYHNNSPDTLTEIIISLFQDFFKKGNVRDWPIPESDLTDGTILKNFLLNGKEIDLGDTKQAVRYNTNLKIYLEDLLDPGESLDFAVEWEFKIPEKEIERMGTYDSTTFFIAYWYPQISVYDDLDQWDKLNFAGRQEFNREFASYKVSITVPKNMLVWATGDLQNPEDVHDRKTLRRLQAAKASDSIVTVYSPADFAPLEYNSPETWVFVADSVTDFSFAAASNMIWDATSLVVDSTNKRRALVGNIYREEEKEHLEIVTRTQQRAIFYFSYIFPGIPYPYSHHTSFFGVPFYDGMEFVMLANNGRSRNYADSVNYFNTINVSIHELAHIYFPYYININERKYCWMEEGMAVFLDLMASVFVFGELGHDIEEYGYNRIAGAFRYVSGAYEEVPLMTHTILLRERHVHRYNSYYKSAWALVILKDVLGEDVFNACFSEFMQRWKMKRPTPYDFFNTFEDVSGRDLEWLWRTWFFGTGYPDLALSELNDGFLTVKKLGLYPIPFELEVEYQDGKVEKMLKGTELWECTDSVRLKIDREKQVSFIRLKSPLDVVEENNLLLTN